MTIPELLEWLLRVAGGGLIVLAALHIPISRRLQWREECTRLSPANEAVFHVHTLFICVVLVLMGLPSLFAPEVLLERTALAKWIAVSWASFWAIRLYCQWFVYPLTLWKGKRSETATHWIFTCMWICLTALYGGVAAWQFGAD